MRLLASGATHPGRVRARNEDAYHVGPGLYVVCDGMGGAARGDVAAELACATVTARYEADALAGLSPAAKLCRAVEAANDAVMHEADAWGEKMGTTIAALAVEDGAHFGVARAAVAWVGDSRCGLLRGMAFHWITRDHSLRAEVARGAKRPLTDVELAQVPANVVTRAIGRAGTKVDVEEVDVRAGDVFLLCSDGVWGEVEDGFGWLQETPERFARLLETHDAKALVSLALELGGRDNCTAVVVRVEA